MFTKIKNILFNTFYFKICLIIVAFLFIIPFTYDYVQQILKGFVIWGILIVLYNVFISKTLYQKKFIFIMVGLFLFFIFLSAIINYQSGMTRNIIIALYLIAEVAVPLIVDQNKPRHKVLHEITIISAIVVIITFIAGILSFIIFLNSTSFYFTNDYGRYYFGLAEGRLWGIFGDPNSGSLIAFISLMVSLMIITILKDNLAKPKKAIPFLYANMVFQLVILYSGNSRAILVSFCATVAVLAIWFLRNHGLPKIKNRILYFGVSAIFVVTASGSVVAFSNISNKLVGFIPKLPIYQIQFEVETLPNDVVSSEEENSNSTSYENPNTGRVYLTSDETNGRFEIWQAGLKTAVNHIFFGVGSNNILNEVVKYIDADFLAKEPTSPSNMHNIYLQVLVGNGIFAFLCFILIMLWFVFRGFCLLFLRKIYSFSKFLEAIIFAFLVGLCVENLFNSNILFFMCLFIAPVFWTYMGYFFYFTYNDKDNWISPAFFSQEKLKASER